MKDNKRGDKPEEDRSEVTGGETAPAGGEQKPRPTEIGGFRGPEPTRYGDWEHNGRCTDF